MIQQEATNHQEAGTASWKMLQGVAAYRLAIAIITVIITHIPSGSPMLGSEYGSWAAYSAIAAVLFSTLHLALAFAKKPETPEFLATLQFPIDFILVTFLVASTGDVRSPLAVLYLLLVLNAAFVLKGFTAHYIAWGAFGILAVIYSTQHEVSSVYSADLLPLWLTGMALVAIASLASTLSTRLRLSEREGVQNAAEISRLSALSSEIIQHMDVGVLVIDGNNQVRNWNGIARNLLREHTPDVSLPAPIRVFPFPLIEAIDNCRGERKESGSKTLVIPPPANKPHQQDRHLNCRCVTLKSDVNGSLILILSDVSHEQERQRQAQLAALGRLAANITHEIRNPLSSIAHAAELLRERAEEGKSQELCAIILKESKRLDNLVESVLAASSPKDPKIEEVPMGAWVQDVMLRLRQDALVKASKLEVTPPSNDLILRVDPHHLEQVLWNLIRNAAQYGKKNNQPASIELKFERESPWEGRISVRDHGPGVDPELRRFLFEPFFTTNSRGSGLGLNISRELITKNKGRIFYQTHPEGGSIFTIVLPAVASAEEVQDTSEPAVESGLNFKNA